MKYCPKCQRQYDSSRRLCPTDGASLSHADPYFLVGQVLMEKYRIEALVGVGGMGAVYSARHLVINKQVAFKILQPNLALGNERMLDLFQREAETAGQLSHENIVDVYDAGRTPTGIAYIAMEWLEGRTLGDDLSPGKPLAFGRAGAILRQVAAALDHAHLRKIVHRDLKPSNIMLVTRDDGREQVKVVDFGIAKVIGATTVSSDSRVLGTPLYASPEQFSPGARVDGRADIYSLGVILYQMLTARTPFYAEAPLELARMHKHETPPPPRDYRPDMPAPIEQLVLRMLEKEPNCRPLTAMAAAEAFEHIIKAIESAKTPVVADHETIPPWRGATDEASADSSRALIESDPARPDRAEAMEPITPDTKRRNMRRRLWIAAGAILALIASILLYLKPAPLSNPNPTPGRVEVMSYYLEVTTGECGKGARTTGDEALRDGQFFRFHFIPRERGYLYIVAPGSQNTPTALLTAQPHPDTGVSTNFLRAGADYSFPQGDGNCLGITKDERMMSFTVVFSPTLLATPGFLASVANQPLTASQQDEFNAWQQQFALPAPEVVPDFNQHLSDVTTLQSKTNQPVIFSLKVKR